MNSHRRVIFIVGVLLAWASNAHAEVMDKEPSLAQIWTVALVLGLLGAAAWRWNSWIGAVVSVLAALAAWAMHTEFADPFVGPAILAEAGRPHIAFAYLAVLACALLHGAGAILRARARSRVAVQTASQ
jgi:hypothetical protein